MEEDVLYTAAVLYEGYGWDSMMQIGDLEIDK
jgi:hypothetical protein